MLFRREAYGVWLGIGLLVGGFAFKAGMTSSVGADEGPSVTGSTIAATSAIRPRGGISTLAKSEPVRLASAEPDLASDASPEADRKAPAAAHFADRFLAAFASTEILEEEAAQPDGPTAVGPDSAAAPMGSSPMAGSKPAGTAAGQTTEPTTAARLQDLDDHTAVYDIAGHTVYLPTGETLEAHSGLGGAKDDPRFVSVRMKGPTPPNLYRLSFREQIFHGVRALRLSPIGEGRMYGRAGLLAHTYMLGPNGQSNGCVSFSNYQAFLRAFESGAVKQMVVVAHLSPSEVAALRHGRTDRLASNASGGSSWWPFGRGQD